MKSIDAPLSRRDRSGFSIIELMIAIVISLIVLVVMMQAFKRASGEIKKGRSMIALASEMRAVGETFRRDLANVTVSPRVWNLSSESNGYFEIVEGLQNDATYADAPLIYQGMSFFGDVDDVVAMTIRSGEKPFRGRHVIVDPLDPTRMITEIVESHVAEVVWFVAFENEDDVDGNVDMDDHVTLYRRVLLVRPNLPLSLNPPGPIAAPGNIDEYFRNNDISARPVAGVITPNSLSDLTLRENRYAHTATAFPFEIQGTWLRDRRIPTGEDIMLTNVAGFDIRVYSPNAPVKTPSGEQFLEPGDHNWTANTTAWTVDGAYVDLGWDLGGTIASWFAAPNFPALAPPLLPSAPLRFSVGNTWCSWSPHYAYGTIATNGLDDPLPLNPPPFDIANGLVDDEAELIYVNAQAPYAYPIRAVQLTMRGIEKSTRNIRQVTITSSFVPE